MHKIVRATSAVNGVQMRARLVAIEAYILLAGAR